MKRRRRAHFAPLLAALAAVLIAAGAYLWLFGGPGSARRAAEIGGPFRLVAGNGAVVTDRDFRGRWMLIYFGYTDCPDVCPTTLSTIAAALDLLGGRAARIAPIFVSIDPRHDTRAVLARYVAGFSPRLIGLTGPPDAIAAMERAWHVSATRVAAPDNTNGTAIAHSAVLYLMRPDGRFATALPALEDAAHLAAALTKAMDGTRAPN